ncbi:MAG TPA: aldo/keto reductase [Terriglobales bacterium]|nr:aldo/keto reductase [Terriglobales bacterium]
MQHVTLKNGDRVPALGLGTWRMGEQRSQAKTEIAALQHGIDLGMTLIDTAEMYGDGGAEQAVGEAIRGRRDGVYLVSKVLPQNASRKGTIAACEASLKRLGTDRLDLYLLHWRGNHPLADTMAAFLELQQAGKIRAFGVSNLDLADMQDWLAVTGAAATVVNQVQYSINSRGIDFDLMPWSIKQQIAVMAYCPLAQGDIPEGGALRKVAARHNATPAQIMLAWCLRSGHVIAVPKTSNPARVAENAKAADIRLSVEDLAELDKDFPAPQRAQSLAMT